MINIPLNCPLCNYSLIEDNYGYIHCINFVKNIGLNPHYIIDIRYNTKHIYYYNKNKLFYLNIRNNNFCTLFFMKNPISTIKIIECQLNSTTNISNVIDKFNKLISFTD